MSQDSEHGSINLDALRRAAQTFGKSAFTSLRAPIECLAYITSIVGPYKSMHFRANEIALFKTAIGVIKEQVAYIEARLNQLEAEKAKETRETGAYILAANDDATWLNKLPKVHCEQCSEPAGLFWHWSGYFSKEPVDQLKTNDKQ